MIAHDAPDRLAEGFVVIQLRRVHHDRGSAHQRTRPPLSAPAARPTWSTDCCPVRTIPYTQPVEHRRLHDARLRGVLHRRRHLPDAKRPAPVHRAARLIAGLPRTRPGRPWPRPAPVRGATFGAPGIVLTVTVNLELSAGRVFHATRVRNHGRR